MTTTELLAAEVALVEHIVQIQTVQAAFAAYFANTDQEVAA